MFAAGIKLDVLWNIATYSGPVSGWPVTPPSFAASVGLANIDSFEGTNESNDSCTSNASWTSATKTQQANLWNSMQANGLGALPLLAPSYGACQGLATMTSDAASMGSLSAYSTYGNLHSYPGTNNYPEIGCITAAQSSGCGESYWLQASSIENPGENVVVTETGYESQKGGCQWNAGTVGQERYLLRALLNDWNQGILRTYLFEFLDDHATDGCYLGIMNDSYSVKPSFTAIKNLIATLTDPGSSFSAGALNYAFGAIPSSIEHTLLQKRNGSFELILWQAVPSINSSGSALTVSPKSVTLTFPSGPTSISAQSFTNAGTLASVTVMTANHISTVPVTDVPVIVTIQQ